MAEAAFHQTLPKPRFGEACNGCGLCCLAVQCPLSLGIFGEQQVCPAIEQGEGGALVCGLIVSTADYVPDFPAWGGMILSEAFALMLGAGVGCDGQAEGEELVEDDRQRMRSDLQAKLATGSPEAMQLVRYFASGLA